MNVLTGDVIATRGDAWVSEASVWDSMTDIYATLGFCPQVYIWFSLYEFFVVFVNKDTH